MVHGTCLCGEVAFSVTPLPRTSACHCSQCRKQSGHHWASGMGMAEAFEIMGEVTWYRATPKAKRGFCGTCGSFLFWKHDDEPEMSFSLGVLDGPTGMTLPKHIFVADKGDYYTLADGLPQQDR